MVVHTLIPALGQLRQINHKFENSQGYEEKKKTFLQYVSISHIIQLKFNRF
jgi:hypothetical protein